MANNDNINGVSERLGKLSAKMETVLTEIVGTREEVKKLSGFQHKTEERLRQGVETFKNHSKEIKKAKEDIEAVEKKIIKVPNKWIVYSMLIIGFMILGLLVSINNVPKNFFQKDKGLTTNEQSGKVRISR